MLILLITVFSLMLWSVKLMVSAFRQSDFSLLFAGTLVAISSAGIVTAYSLMNGCMGYLSVSEVVVPGTAQSEFLPVLQSDILSESASPLLEEVPNWDVDA